MHADGVAMRKPATELTDPVFDSGAQSGVDMQRYSPAPSVCVSAVIVTYNTGASLWECLETVRDDPSVGEVVIVNNGNPDAQCVRLHDLTMQHSKFKFLDGHGNVGFAKACNLGAEAATGRYLLFLNPDAVLERNTVNAMIAAGESRSGLWLVGGMLLDAFGKEQRGARRGKLTLWNAAASFTGLSKVLAKIGGSTFHDVHWEHSPLPDAPAIVPTVSGALMLMPAAKFHQIGGFDESYFLHVEDIDLCRRIVEEGGEVVFAPQARAKHYGSTSGASRVWVEWQKGRGFDIYFRKFAGNPAEEVLALLLSPVVRAALVARAVFLSMQLTRRSANMKRLRARVSARRDSKDADPQYQDNARRAARKFA